MRSRDALDFAVQIGEALVAAHERGIVHRDIKPANLFVTHGDLLKVLDFGLAKIASRSQPITTPLTGQTGAHAARRAGSDGNRRGGRHRGIHVA